MDWTSVLTTFLGAALGAAVPVIGVVFWLGGITEKVRALCERCTKRESDHCHHYTAINQHEVRLGQIDTRVCSLEQWRTREET